MRMDQKQSKIGRTYRKDEEKQSFVFLYLSFPEGTLFSSLIYLLITMSWKAIFNINKVNEGGRKTVKNRKYLPKRSL